MSKTAAEVWANFLFNEKLTQDILEQMGVSKLIDFFRALEAKGRPDIRSHTHKMAARRLLVNTAMECEIDLTKLKKFGGKVAMGRGLLDVWNEEYKKRFGGNIGTDGVYEAKRRNVVTKLSNQRAEEYRNGTS